MLGIPASSSQFTGYTGQVAGGFGTEGNRPVPTAPWNEDMFEPPSEVFMNFGYDQRVSQDDELSQSHSRESSIGTSGRDPWVENDPWRGASLSL